MLFTCCSSAGQVLLKCSSRLFKAVQMLFKCYLSAVQGCLSLFGGLFKGAPMLFKGFERKHVGDDRDNLLILL